MQSRQLTLNGVQESSGLEVDVGRPDGAAIHGEGGLCNSHTLQGRPLGQLAGSGDTSGRPLHFA